MIQRPKNNPRHEDTGFPTSKDVQDTEVIKQDGMLLIDYLEKRATITAKYYVALLDKLNKTLVSKHQGKLSKGILFLQENVAAPHKAAIEELKLADFTLKF
jgi:hypothetical protein